MLFRWWNHLCGQSISRPTYEVHKNRTEQHWAVRMDAPEVPDGILFHLAVVWPRHFLDVGSFVVDDLDEALVGIRRELVVGVVCDVLGKIEFDTEDRQGQTFDRAENRIRRRDAQVIFANTAGLEDGQHVS